MSNVPAKDDRLKIILFVLSYCLVFGLGVAAGRVNEPSSSTTQPTEQVANEDSKAEATPEPIKVDLSGNSNTATQKFKLRSGLATFKMHYGGDSNFIAHLMDTEGNDIESLVNEIGAFDGSKAVKIDLEGEYLINVDAMGDWSITITQ